VRSGIRFAAVVTALALLSGCTRTVVRSGGPRVPPIPSESPADLGPSEPPVVWVGGTVTSVRSDRLEIRESSGSMVTLRRLGQDATGFFRISGNGWLKLDPLTAVEAGQQACIEALAAGANLLALRVFLGTACGPA
jgi:hypothetical protein